MANTNPIESIYNKLVLNMKGDPNMERRVQIELEKQLRKLYSDAIGQTTGYCMTFKIPEKEILNIPTIMGLDVADIKSAFAEGWNVPETAYMYNNPYYHVLLLCCAYGLRKRNESMQKAAHSLLMCKIWNGRRIHYVKWCNPDVMRYVIANLSGKYTARKYDSPIAMLIQYFTPTLLKKYGPWIEGDIFHTKRLFDQSWGRIEQLFVSNKGIDIRTGQTKARSGLAPAYYDAREKGLKISKPTSSSVSHDSDDVMTSVDYYSSHEFDDLISGAVNYITMNINPTYEQNFLKFVIKSSTVNAQAVHMILHGLHDTRYSDHIRDILELMFKQLQITARNEICSQQFISEVVKRKFISSKHSPNIVQLKKIIDKLLEMIFDEKIKYVKYSNYSVPRQGHIRKVVFYGFAYNLQKFLCTGGASYGQGV